MQLKDAKPGDRVRIEHRDYSHSCNGYYNSLGDQPLICTILSRDNTQVLHNCVLVGWENNPKQGIIPIIFSLFDKNFPNINQGINLLQETKCTLLKTTSTPQNKSIIFACIVVGAALSHLSTTKNKEQFNAVERL